MPEIQPWPEDSIEKIAYRVVDDLPFREMNDKNRMGYHVYLYLSKQYPSLPEAIRVAQARMSISTEEATRLIIDRLRAEGIDVKE